MVMNQEEKGGEEEKREGGGKRKGGGLYAKLEVAHLSLTPLSYSYRSVMARGE